MGLTNDARRKALELARQAHNRERAAATPEHRLARADEMRRLAQAQKHPVRVETRDEILARRRLRAAHG